GSAAVLGLGMQLRIALIPSNGAINSYQWTGPNGFTSNEQNPILNNPIAGNYTLSVQAALCGNVSETITLTTSTNCPNASFTSTPAIACAGNPVNFTNQTTPSNSDYFWLF